MLPTLYSKSAIRVQLGNSIRIGGACALLAAGYDDTVIKVMSRWASWCF